MIAEDTVRWGGGSILPEMATNSTGDDPFWLRITKRSLPRIESWIQDQCEYLLQIASVVIALVVFKGLRIMGLTGWVIDVLEVMDRIAIVLVFGRFLFSVIRRAFVAGEES